MSDSAFPRDFDPEVPEDFDSPHALFDHLRAQCPVAHTDRWGGFWALTRHADVKRAASDSDTFITSVQNVIPKVAFTGRRPPLHLDPPEHTPYRRALNPLLSRDNALALEPEVRAITIKLLTPLIAAGHGDICGEFSSHLPVHVFGAWMNLSGPWLETLHEAGRAFILSVHLNDEEKMKSTSLRLYEMARELIAQRHAEPLPADQDPTSALLAARDPNGDPLPDEMIVGTVRQLLVVGIVAPMVMIGNMAVHLSRHADLQAHLRANPQDIADAVEEFLRLYSPYRGFARTATCPVRFGERTIPEGDAIALVYASANRDESVFDDAASFRLRRDNISEHLAFGRGPHHCPGAQLGRLQLRVALEELLARTRHFEVEGDILMTKWPEVGAVAVPLRFEAG